MKQFGKILCIIMMCFVLVGCLDYSPKTIQIIQDNPPSEVENPTQNYTEVRVSTPYELMQNIKSNTKIILTEDYYNLSSIEEPLTSENINVDDWFVGNEYSIHDIEHLEICTENQKTAKMVVTSGHVNVLNFQDCYDIKLSGLVLGHEVEKGTCFGGVLHLEDCKNVELRDCHLYGCGTYGIIAEDTTNLVAYQCEIYDCTEGILHLEDCENTYFEKTSFHNNEEYSGFVLTDCKDFTLESCSVTQNSGKEYCALFLTSGCSGIILSNSTFKENSYPAFGDKEEYLIINCNIEDENFDEPVYYDIEPDN